MANFLITTTPILSNVEILNYIGPLTANVVLGVNFFSDFAASITDIFGGNSETYQGKLDQLTDQVSTQIKDKAIRLGANAIIDYKLTFNEISGKGKQMFMVTATGTACNIVMPENDEVKRMGDVAYADIYRQLKVATYTAVLEKNRNITEDDWKVIIDNGMSELAAPLAKEYLRLQTHSATVMAENMYRDAFSAKFQEYLSKVNKATATQVLSSFIEQYPAEISKLMIKHNIFSAKDIMFLLDSDRLSLAIELLHCHKDFYSATDLSEMKQIVAKLESLPDKGKYEFVKTGMFSKKEEEMYVCPKGHKNPKEEVYCSCDGCHLNIKGLTKLQQSNIDEFIGFVSALENILNAQGHES